MTDLSLVRFEIGDLVNFEPLNENKYLWRDMSANMDNPNRLLFSLIHSETKKVYALCGMNVLRPGTVEVWSIRGKDFDEYKFNYFKILRRFIHNDILSEVSEIDRVEIGIRCDEPELFKWAEKLGGEYECTAKKYCKGIDHRVYSIVRED